MRACNRNSSVKRRHRFRKELSVGSGISAAPRHPCGWLLALFGIALGSSADPCAGATAALIGFLNEEFDREVSILPQLSTRLGSNPGQQQFHDPGDRVLQGRFSWQPFGQGSAAFPRPSPRNSGPALTEARAVSGSASSTWHITNATRLAAVQVRAEKLQSGVTVIVARTPPDPSREPRIFVGSYVRFGTMQEKTPGEAHLMEHIIANSPSAVSGPRPPDQPKLFGSNALTKPNYTSFDVIVSLNGLEQRVHAALAAMGRKAKLPEVFGEQVHNVVAELGRDRAKTYIVPKALQAMARRQSALITDEISWTQAVDEASVRARIQETYFPRAGILVIAGDVDAQAAFQAARAAERRLRLEAIDGRTARSSSGPILTGVSRTIQGQNTGETVVAGLAWPQPPVATDEHLALLIADQLLLGGREDPADVVRSDAAPLPKLLKESLGAWNFQDGRDAHWGAPPIADLNPSLYIVQFRSPRRLSAPDVRQASEAALREIRRTALTDRSIVEARRQLADFYERWLLEPTNRILADHLAAYAMLGRQPAQVKNIARRIRKIELADVRAAVDRYLMKVSPLVIVMPPMQTSGKIAG